MALLRDGLARALAVTSRWTGNPLVIIRGVKSTAVALVPGVMNADTGACDETSNGARCQVNSGAGLGAVMKLRRD